ncbi:tubby-related protein 4 isoform X1 [Canis lupus baileyi]|uniref:tubby-related protein 4 isoform X1 n=1 Tax=Canis lupus familiaris TaxID=9615 RepID=UPI0018F6FEC4|nr:tubby-related protein 4 isoform X1 [Canis lupus familiaris]XP_038382368.1 tubby-related protein 4 isoform X1 [Canis lupus familiaris]XP_038382369.1 tubby-related protein 4 isoform X1 [Canis lupus familiaris]XP_038382370.1 tubby-related protein 4 isoform X1 [Canis lupus familiaris]XP_038510455.1 tubby-related protein 4 isoform X1 [Canis lupus familiaris]XP_038510456.1 tubby-related protein 4 isoform X1 [Canis lupus familiaris]XP_038510457.1 tubby-related protein 4 isoform X1 [Canis lupus fa
MYAAVEHGPVLCSDSNILCLSWKGRVPKSEKEKPVCRRRYYEEGWLATGNGRGVVGVTFTSSHCRRDRNTPQRINFNLRGHNSEVVLVRWNEPYQKLATCDADGGIFVWIQYEGRWSVELVNDRGAQVSDFTWSHDGTQALISYRDGFVLVGSVSGQRHWSSEINLESQITCGIWTPDDQQVLFGTADGQVIVMDCHGRMLAHVLLHESDGILSMSWNYPAFLVEDSSESDTDSDDYSPPQDGPAAYPIPVQNIKPLLTVSFTSGDISLMNNYDDLSPTVIRSGLKEVVTQWCTQGDLLAVAGMERQTQLGDLPNGPLLKNAMVKFYNVRGEHIFTLDTLVQRPIVSICWGHRDSRLLMASGPALYVVRVEHRVSSLQLLCQQAIASALREDKDVSKLTLPPRLCSYLSTAFIPTIKPPIPDPNNMRDFVSYPSAGNERLHCTMKRTEDDPEVGGPCYTLYLEYLGGLVPILKGRRISKLRPEFVIMDPRTDSKSDEIYGNSLISAMLDSCNCSDSSDVELSDDWAAKKSPKISRASKSPKLPRLQDSLCILSVNLLAEIPTATINIEARKSPKLSRAAQEMSRSPRLPMRKPSIGSPSLTRREFPFEDITQHNYLAQVTSNIWGTKFKIVGLAAFLPTNLGAVIYKTSLLHLQPRQMTIYLPEVRKISMDYVNLPVFNPNVFSEDEDDLPVTGTSGVPENNPPCTVNIPIAPIHSSAQAMSPTQSIGLVQSLLANQNVQLDVLTNQTTAVGTSEHGSDSTTQYPISNRYSNPGQVIFGGVEMGRIIPNPAQLSLPPPAQGAIQLSVVDHGDRDHDHLQKAAKALRPVAQLAAEGDAVVFSAPQEVQVAKMNPPPPYPGTIPAAPTTAAPPPPLPPPQPPVDTCLKKGDFSLYPTAAHYQTPLGYERITTFDSSGNVEEVCRPRTRMLCSQNTYTLPGPGSSATLRLTATEKKVPQPCTSATLNRLTVPRYSIPTGDPPPYPEIAGPLMSGRGAAQRPDSLIHATLRRNNREVALKAAQLAEPPRAPPQHPPKPKGAAQFPARPPPALYTCSQCSSGGSAGRPEPGAGTGGVQPGSGLAHAASTSPLTSQSSYSLLSPPDGGRDRADYVNSAFTEDEALAQHCPVEKPLRHPTLSEAAVAVKRPPPYQWDPVLGEDIWVPQERTAQTAVPHPLKLSPLIVGQSQHLDVSRVPFVSPKSPASPTATFQTGYGMGMPYPGSYNAPPMPGVQTPCSPKDALSPTQFAPQESTVVLQPAYPPSLSYCTLPPMYPGSSTCSSLQLPPIALHPWNSYSPCPPVQNPQGTLPPKAHLVVEKPLVSPPPTDLQSHLGTEVMVETTDNFQEVLSLTESPVPQRTEKFGKKNRKRLDSRAEEGNVQAITEGKVKKEARTLSDFNSLISSPRLGREKKKVKSQKDQLKSKKLNKTNEFQDSSESEPELFISGDELMNQSQGSKKGWKSKRSLRTASELEEFKCRKASEKEDGRLGSQGFVYVMANKQPLWNEATQVYQLDFGGRVTQESAKNFQIELEGRQVMQFGRIDGNAYILDFQYPFSAVQAFAVALANVTQRLK